MLAELLTPENIDVQITVAQQAFTVLADIEVFPVPPAPELVIIDPNEIADIRATICYMGESEGSIRIECSPSIAFAFTERMTGAELPQAFNEDVRDAIGELINTIGGNLKGLLPAGTRINTPLVFPQPADKLHHHEPEPQLSCLNFNSQFGPFRIVLLDTLPDAA
jgi:CheY-specific phosphatase CheX